MLQIGDQFSHIFRYTQEDVNLYAKVSGDVNPLHIDPEAGKASIFGRNIIHGFLGGSVFTKIFGALWKADGHVYLKQSMQWLKPMFVETDYEAVITVKEVFPEKNRVLYDCAIFDKSTGEQCFTGEALLMNKKQYVW
ncbi:MAG: MaoC family dehydratase [Saprospiraceae bacterium]|nr:MaoC family dehydratase [Saprospiraceae bacterium]MBK7738376.1 MaoC family dehydratase [Saprospiraceae bacterium]MBK7913051.1 MaoC family dehydratase [Saprospiraceae bacterium]